jgi:hypothetical protein
MADEQEERELTPEEKYAPKLPQQVQNQVDAVNAALAQAAGAAEEQQPEDGEEYQQGVEYDAEDQGDEETPDQSPAPEESWEQRARSSQGRLDQALNANMALSRRVSDLEQQLSTMQVRGAEAPAPLAPVPRQKLIKPEELNDYGEEFFDVVGRRAKEELVPEIETLAERIKRLESGQRAVGEVVEKTQKRGLYDTLYDEVPDWKEINHHPAFINWLSFPDPYSGRQRHELLKDAFSRHEADRVVNFFRGFLTEATGTPPNVSRQNGTSAPPLPNGNGSGKPTLEQFAAPGRARSAPQELPPDKPVYTHAWIAQFSADKRRGMYRGREAEVEAIERDIYQAQHEGRIQ